MKKKKLKAKIRKLEAQVLDARVSAVSAAIAKLLIGRIVSAPNDEPESIGVLRRAAEAAAAKGK